MMVGRGVTAERSTGNRLRIALNDDFGSRLDTWQEGPNVYEKFGIADVHNYPRFHTFDKSDFLT